MTGEHVKVAFLLKEMARSDKNIKYNQKLKFIVYKLNRKKGKLCQVY